MATKKQTTPAKQYTAYNAEDLKHCPAGWPTMEEAVEGSEWDGEPVVIYELVEVGTFEIKNRIALNKIK